MKQCSVCKQMKDESKFSKDKSRKGGLAYRCKNCHSDYNKEHREEKKKWQNRYYKEHKGECLARMKRWRKKHKTECLTIAMKWKEKNPEKRLASNKKYYEIHRAEIISGTKKWQEENSEQYKKLHKKAVAKRKRTLNWIELYPNPFNKCEKIAWHHIDNTYVVALPKDLHQLNGIYSGRNVEQHRINLSYITEQIYAHRL